MLIDDIRTRITAAVKANDSATRDVLRLVLGEVQAAQARQAAADTPSGDDQVRAVLRKVIKSNEETLSALAPGDARAAELTHEIAALRAFLPAELSIAQIVELLASHTESIRAAKTEGQAVGIAMKAVKASGVTATGPSVTSAVQQIRA